MPLGENLGTFTLNLFPQTLNSWLKNLPPFPSMSQLFWWCPLQQPGWDPQPLPIAHPAYRAVKVVRCHPAVFYLIKPWSFVNLASVFLFVLIGDCWYRLVILMKRIRPKVGSCQEERKNSHPWNPKNLFGFWVQWVFIIDGDFNVSRKAICSKTLECSFLAI